MSSQINILKLESILYSIYLYVFIYIINKWAQEDVNTLYNLLNKIIIIIIINVFTYLYA
jgi:hypothetical protein